MKTSELTFGYRVCHAVCCILGCEPFIVKQTWLALCSFLGIAQLMVNVMLNLNCFARSRPTLFGGSLRVLSYAYARLTVSEGALVRSTIYLADYLLVMMTLQHDDVFCWFEMGTIYDSTPDMQPNWLTNG
jgi:hypothetical protein